ncbi:hypothetical protein K4F52_005065 [Lecanicillium sp. MT-2017a]|nr:hypothetical protein K4F52_005065 [Lecanicillium sp. MT-2017a]
MHIPGFNHIAVLAISLTACQALQAPDVARDLGGHHKPGYIKLTDAQTVTRLDAEGKPLDNPDNHEPYSDTNAWEPYKLRNAREAADNIQVRAPKGGKGGSSSSDSSSGSGSSSDSDSSSSSGGSSYGGKGGKGGSGSCRKSCGYMEAECNGGCIPSMSDCCTISSSPEYCSHTQVCVRRGVSSYYCCPPSEPNCDYYTEGVPTVSGTSQYCASEGANDARGATVHAGALMAAAGVFAGAANLIL